MMQGDIAHLAEPRCLGNGMSMTGENLNNIMGLGGKSSWTLNVTLVERKLLQLSYIFIPFHIFAIDIIIIHGFGLVSSFPKKTSPMADMLAAPQLPQPLLLQA